MNTLSIIYLDYQNLTKKKFKTVALILVLAKFSLCIYNLGTKPTEHENYIMFVAFNLIPVIASLAHLVNLIGSEFRMVRIYSGMVLFSWLIFVIYGATKFLNDLLSNENIFASLFDFLTSLAFMCVIFCAEEFEFKQGLDSPIYGQYESSLFGRLMLKFMCNFFCRCSQIQDHEVKPLHPCHSSTQLGSQIVKNFSNEISKLQSTGHIDKCALFRAIVKSEYKNFLKLSCLILPFALHSFLIPIFIKSFTELFTRNDLSHTDWQWYYVSVLYIVHCSVIYLINCSAMEMQFTIGRRIQSAIFSLIFDTVIFFKSF